MFQLKASEITDSLKSQFATLSVSENKRGMHTAEHPVKMQGRSFVQLIRLQKPQLFIR